MEEKELKALITLLDDDDTEVKNHVEEKIISLGTQTIPFLEECLQSLRLDLGPSRLTYSRALIYAIAEGRGTSPHFDQNINFVIQLSGTKRWWIAPNKSVQNPMTRYTIGTEPDPELAGYLEAPMPKSFPKEEATEYILRPGSILFLPRGSWHTTKAESLALSLNFTYSAPTWIDIVICALRSRLSTSPDWRATADFLTDNQLDSDSIAKFDELLMELSYDFPNLRADEILKATEQN